MGGAYDDPICLKVTMIGRNKERFQLNFVVTRWKVKVKSNMNDREWIFRSPGITWRSGWWIVWSLSLKVTQRDVVTASADFFLSFNMSGLLFTILVAMVSMRRLIGIVILRSQVCVPHTCIYIGSSIWMIW